MAKAGYESARLQVRVDVDFEAAQAKPAATIAALQAQATEAQAAAQAVQQAQQAAQAQQRVLNVAQTHHQFANEHFIQAQHAEAQQVTQAVATKITPLAEAVPVQQPAEQVNVQPVQQVQVKDDVVQQQAERKLRPPLPHGSGGDKADGAGQGGNENRHPRVLVRRDVIERAVDLDTGIEHIHAVQEWPLQVVRRSPTPHRNW